MVCVIGVKRPCKLSVCVQCALGIPMVMSGREGMTIGNYMQQESAIVWRWSMSPFFRLYWTNADVPTFDKRHIRSTDWDAA